MTPNYRTGLVFVLAANTIWGLSPLLWHALEDFSAWEIILHRSLWSLPLVWVLLWLSKQLTSLQTLTKRQFGLLVLTSFLVSFNWLVFVWAIAQHRLLEASLGYFIYPLCTAFLGVVLLQERLSKPQWFALGLACVGVGVLMLNAKQFPWVALTLAFSFAWYSLLRKQLPIAPLSGLAIEILLLFPIAALAYSHLVLSGQQQFQFFTNPTDWLTPLTGVATVIPLWWMTKGLKNLPLSHAGFIFYWNPSLQFFIAVFLFKEPIHLGILLSFICVWAASALFFFFSPNHPSP